jgi:hypothetical protein
MGKVSSDPFSFIIIFERYSRIIVSLRMLPLNMKNLGIREQAIM